MGIWFSTHTFLSMIMRRGDIENQVLFLCLEFLKQNYALIDCIFNHTVSYANAHAHVQGSGHRLL